MSNFALLAGVTGGGAAAHTQVLIGLAGLAAGACSMAVGEFTSVSSQTELIRAEIAKERRELAENPEEELAELALMYRSKGLPEPLAAQVARELSRDSHTTWRVHAREELGIDPDDLPSRYIRPPYEEPAGVVTALIGAPIFIYLARRQKAMR